MKQKDAQTKRDRLVRVAAVLERYNGTDAISKKSLESKENPCFTVAIQCLRLQILSTPCPLSIDDRVAVVAGAARGSSGRVESIGDDGVVTISVSGAEPCQVEMRHLRRDFRVCDVVEIIRGPKQGTAGFVVEVHTGGFVVFYTVSRLSHCRPPRVFI
jgi:ribosomal protein L24